MYQSKSLKKTARFVCIFLAMLFSFLVAPGLIGASAEETALPASYDISVQNAFPVIGDQDNFNSCVLWSTTYYQYTYQVAKLNGWNAKTDFSKVFSPIYVYYLLNRGYYKSGTVHEASYEILQEFGAVRYSEYNHDSNVDSLCPWASNKWFFVPDDNGNFDYEETVSALTTALQTRISSWSEKQFAPTTVTTPITPSDRSALNEMKTLIANDNVLSFSVGNGKTIEENSDLYTANNGEKYIKYLTQRGSGTGHALTIVGYNDTIWCDLDSDGIQDAFELGAFKIANSWGSDWGSNGFAWLPYDALNKVSYSTASSLRPSNRVGAIEDNKYYTITVANYTPELTVAVTISQNNRMGFKIGLERANYAGNVYCDTVYDGCDALGYISNDAQVPTDFNGNHNSPAYYDRVFVFDYSNPAYIEGNMSVYPYERDGRTVYDEDNAAVYGLVVEDLSATDGNTTVKKIEWKNSSGNVLKTVQPNATLNNSSNTYYVGEFVTSLSLDKDYGEIFVTERETLVATVNSNATQKKVIWTSSDPTIATVNSNGLVTPLKKGIVTITATAMDGSGKSASCYYAVREYYDAQLVFQRNQDSRRVELFFRADAKYVAANIHVGNRMISVLRNGNSYDNLNKHEEKDKVSVTFTQIIGSDDYIWNVTISLDQPTTISTFYSEKLWIELAESGGSNVVRTDEVSGCVFWDNHIKYGIAEGTKIAALIDQLDGNYGEYECYLFNAVTGEYERISYTANTNAGTGMVIVRRMAGKVLDAYYVVIYGDITGSGVIGDGLIDVADALRAMQHLSTNNKLVHALLTMAADANHDGVVTQADADLIMAHAAGIATINQTPAVAPVVPDDVRIEIENLEFDD